MTETRFIWYQLQYGLAALGANNDEHDEAIENVEKLLRVAKATRRTESEKKRKPQDLLTFLDYTVIPAAIVLSAGLRDGRRGEQQAEADSLVAPVLEQRDISYRAAYNLACFYAGRPLRGEATPEAKAYRNETNGARALRYLYASLTTAPPDEQISLADWAEEDPSFDGFPPDALHHTIAPFQSAPGPGGRLAPPPTSG